MNRPRGKHHTQTEDNRRKGEPKRAPAIPATSISARRLYGKSAPTNFAGSWHPDVAHMGRRAYVLMNRPRENHRTQTKGATHERKAQRSSTEVNLTKVYKLLSTRQSLRTRAQTHNAEVRKAFEPYEKKERKKKKYIYIYIYIIISNIPK